jgi:hypothetical protein
MRSNSYNDPEQVKEVQAIALRELVKMETGAQLPMTHRSITSNQTDRILENHVKDQVLPITVQEKGRY